MRIFRIWNHSYKAMDFFADDALEALAMARANRHIRGRHRKFQDCTAAHMAELPDCTTRALDSGRKGEARYLPGEGWQIEGQVV